MAGKGTQNLRPREGRMFLITRSLAANKGRHVRMGGGNEIGRGTIRVEVPTSRKKKERRVYYGSPKKLKRGRKYCKTTHLDGR